jgi:hypothetical protein
LILGLGLSIKNGLKGWANIYLGREDYWNDLFWKILGPLMVLAAVLAFYQAFRGAATGSEVSGNSARRDFRIIWLVLIVQNVIAQLITGPHSNWNETIFSIYYLLLLAIAGVIVYHYHRERCSGWAAGPDNAGWGAVTTSPSRVIAD